ncbi:MAG: hypothetical protein D6722_21170, partial [Bacteroidetes bacterium]
ILHRNGLEFFFPEADMASFTDRITLLYSPQWHWLDREVDSALFRTSPGYNLRFQGDVTARVRGEVELEGPIYLARGARVEENDKVWTTGRTLHFDLNISRGDQDWLQVVPLGRQAGLKIRVQTGSRELAANQLLLGGEGLPLAEPPFKFGVSDLGLLRADHLPEPPAGALTVNLWYRDHQVFADMDNQALPGELRQMLKTQGYIR